MKTKLKISLAPLPSRKSSLNNIEGQQTCEAAREQRSEGVWIVVWTVVATKYTLKSKHIRNITSSWTSIHLRGTSRWHQYSTLTSKLQRRTTQRPITVSLQLVKHFGPRRALSNYLKCSTLLSYESCRHVMKLISTIYIHKFNGFINHVY